MIITYNDDILIEIFTWLPAKSLLRFKLVCKHWFSLISTNHFSQKHTLNHALRSRTRPSLLTRISGKPGYFYLHLEKSSLIPYRFSPSLVEPTVLSFANGLFLLQCTKTNNPPEKCFVYNPTTKQSQNISLKVVKEHQPVIGLNIAFDPLNSTHYKIICVRSVQGPPSGSIWPWWRLRQVEVYKSEDCSWNLCGEPFWAPLDMDFNRGVYSIGCIHWHGMFFHVDGGFIGKHPKIEVPGGSGTSLFYADYVESCGHLHCIAHFPRNNKVMVFELERDFSKWSLKYSFDLGGAAGLLSVLGVVGEESEEDGVLVFHEPGKVLAYKFRGEIMKELVDFRGEGFYAEGQLQLVSNQSFEFVDILACV